MNLLGFVFFPLIAIHSLVLKALAPKIPQPKPPGITDFDIPTAEEGRPLPMHFGSPDDVAANVIWDGDLRTKKIKTKGGKK